MWEREKMTNPTEGSDDQQHSWDLRKHNERTLLAEAKSSSI